MFVVVYMQYCSEQQKYTWQIDLNITILLIKLFSVQKRVYVAVLRLTGAADSKSFLACFYADRGKDKSQGNTKPVNKANSAAAKVTTSNGNGALNR